MLHSRVSRRGLIVKVLPTFKAGCCKAKLRPEHQLNKHRPSRNRDTFYHPQPHIRHNHTSRPPLASARDIQDRQKNLEPRITATMPRHRAEHSRVAFTRIPLIAAFLLLAGVVVLLMPPTTASSTTSLDFPLSSQTSLTQMPEILRAGKSPPPAHCVPMYTHVHP